MAITTPSLDYSDRDFDSLRLRLQDTIRSVFTEWTDFNVANFGNILLEMFCHVGDMLHFYQDNQAIEAFWPIVSRRISAIRMGRLIDFKLTGAAPSTGTVTFTTPVSIPAGDKIVIPEGTVVSTADSENPVRYRTTAAAEILSGSTTVDVAIEQAELISNETFDSTDEPNQEFILSRTPYLDSENLDTVTPTYRTTITAGGIPFTEVSTFISSGPNDNHFTVLVDDQDAAHIRFGNGTNGKIPTGQIVVEYKVGGGSIGNAESNKITILENTVAYDSGGTAPISITNASPTVGGVDRMTLDEARSQAPASLRVLNRTVTKEDFENVATSVRGTARALMATSNEDGAIPENFGRLYVVAQGTKYESGRIAPATPSSTLLADIATEINTNKPSTITFTFEVLAAAFKDITVSTNIWLSQGADATTVGADIRAALQDFFAAQLSEGEVNPAIDFGANLKDQDGNPVYEIAWSDVFNAIRDVSGIRKVDEGADGLLLGEFGQGTGSRQSISLTALQFPRLSTVTIINAATGAAI